MSRLSKNARLSRLSTEFAALGEITEKLGFEEHIRTDYGDESQYRAPWEIFDRESAEEALSLARQAQDIARKIIEQWPQKEKQ